MGVAHGIGDSLTFWILDHQSKYVSARLHHNLRVKWDPELTDTHEKSTAAYGRDIMPTEATEEIDILEAQVEQVEATVPSPSKTSVSSKIRLC